MKNRKSFLKGALCGALAMLLAAGLVSCGLKVNSGSSDITSKTEDKISELQNLVKKHYMGDVKEKNLEDGIYKGYINGLNDPFRNRCCDVSEHGDRSDYSGSDI